MKRLTKQDEKRKDELSEKLRNALAELTVAVEDFNTNFEKLQDAVQEKLNTYNEALQQADEFRQDIASQIDSEMSERSEKWLESEAGQQCEQWKGEWENDIESLEIEFPDAIALPDEESADAFDNLPSSADEC